MQARAEMGDREYLETVYFEVGHDGGKTVADGTTVTVFFKGRVGLHMINPAQLFAIVTPITTSRSYGTCTLQQLLVVPVMF